MINPLRKLYRRFFPKCEHAKYKENMACNGICLSCGEDLGFIQRLRESNPRGETGFQSWDKDIKVSGRRWFR